MSLVPVATAFAATAQAGLVNIGGVMPFVRTPLANGVDDSGLLVAETPLTRVQIGQIAAGIDRRAKAEGVTHGQIAMHGQSGNPYVMARGTRDNPTMLHRSLVAMAPDRPESLVWGQGDGANLTTSFTGQIVPASEVYADPNFANHPAVNLTWYHGASLAAALTAMDSQYVVRMMTSGEFDRLVLCDGEMTEDDVIKMAHLYRDGVSGTAPVIGEAAQGRTNKWGLVDMFGNVWIWTLDPNDPEAVQRGEPIQKVTRVLRGASWYHYPQYARVAVRSHRLPTYSYDFGGVRFVAVPRAPQ